MPVTSAAALPPIPAGFSSTFQLGMADTPGGAANVRAMAPFAYRYQYLSGGANTGTGWATWNTGGNFVTYYIQDSSAHSITPVFTYFQLRQSNPGASAGEADGDYNNLQNATTMTAYYNDLKLFFQRAGATGTRTILHVEPDAWGYLEQKSGASNDAGTLPAKVASTGMPELAGLPNTVSGYAQAFVKLRDTYAPNVTLAYHLSVWGTGTDILYSDPADATVDSLAAKAASFYTSLHTNFDVVFAEFSDRDSGFKQYVYGDGGASWWKAADFARNTRFLGDFVAATQKRIVMWQIPFGNTKMLAENNTWDHYQDNKVEYFLDDATHANLNAYIQAGVIAFLFGRGADGNSGPADSSKDGITNPAAINGNTLTSLNADDDGGFFRQKSAAYYAAGALPLDGSFAPQATPTATSAASTPTATFTSVPSSPTSTPTKTSTPGATSTATPTKTSTPKATATATRVAATWTTSASGSPASVKRGGSEKVTVNVKSSQTTTAFLDVEIFAPNGTRVSKTTADRQSFTANVTKSFSSTGPVASNAPTGVYTIKVGIYTVGGGTLLNWNSNAGSFTVTN